MPYKNVIKNCFLLGFIHNQWHHQRRPAKHSCWRTACVLGLLAAGAASALELNSERIERLYGSYGVEILRQTEQLRVTSLYSEHAADKTCRTLAIVHFEAAEDASLAAAHSEIRAGASIGATLTRHGWTVNKETQHIGDLVLATDARKLAALMRIDTPERLALHLYRLHVTKGSRTTPYATIAELHHPDYLSTADLAEMHPEPATAQPPEALRQKLAEIERIASRLERR